MSRRRQRKRSQRAEPPRATGGRRLAKAAFVLAALVILSTAVAVGLLSGSSTDAQHVAGTGDEPVNVIISYYVDPDEQDEDEIEALGGSVQHRYHLISGIAATVPQSALDDIEGDQDVEFVESDYWVFPDLTPNDTYYATYLWGLNNTGQTGGTPDADIDAPEAWDIITGSSDVVIAVIDTGVDIDHPDLAANIWTNPGEIPDNGVDDDGNGYVDDIHGWDFYHDDNSVFDQPLNDEHGTHVSGTIAAEGNNGIGVTGVNWQAQAMVLKFVGPPGGLTSDAIRALEYATDKGVKVTNNSWGGGDFSQSLKNAIEACGCLFVAAAGNDGTDLDEDEPHYPASYNSPNLISVAATDDTDGKASLSNYGVTSVDLGGPGVDIVSTVPGGYGYDSGTSMAAPHVTGVAGLLLAQNSTLTSAQLKDAILNSVDPVSALDGITVTGGRLNAFEAVSAVAPPPPQITTTSLPDGTVGVAYSETLQATGGTPPYTWAITAGTLPAGLSLNASTGEISGTPTTAETQNFTVTVTDDTLATDSQPLSITTACAGGEYGTLYIDVLPDANNTTAGFGAIEVCRDTDELGDPLDVGDTFTIDIAIDDAPQILGAGFTLNYKGAGTPPAVLKVTDYNWGSWKFGPGGIETSDPMPDTDDTFWTQYKGQATNADGVLIRITLQAVSDGTSDLTLTDAVVWDCCGAPHSPPEVGVHDPFGSIRVSVGTPCDNDSDGLPDGYELQHGCLDWTVVDAYEDPDSDGLTNIDEYNAGTDPCNPDSDADEVSDGPDDPDGEGPIVAGPDNCPLVANPGQEDFEPDGIGDACDDSDEDSQGLGEPPFFVDAKEPFIGTDPLDDCADTSSVNDERGPDYGEPLSPWPPDFNDNGETDIGDLVLLKNHWPPLGGTYGVRYDLNANGECDIGDLVILKQYWKPPVGPGGTDTCTVG